MKTLVIDGFRPLAGFWFLNSPCKRSHSVSASLFPSPCGVLVLKSVTSRITARPCVCFRPLAGFWFLNVRQNSLR